MDAIEVADSDEDEGQLKLVEKDLDTCTTYQLPVSPSTEDVLLGPDLSVVKTEVKLEPADVPLTVLLPAAPQPPLTPSLLVTSQQPDEEEEAQVAADLEAGSENPSSDTAGS